MNTDIVPFEYDGGTPVRVVMIDGEPWWVAADIAKALGMTGTSAVSMMVKSLDDDEKGINFIDTPGGAQNTVIINEPGLYRILMRGKLYVEKDRFILDKAYDEFVRLGRFPGKR